MKNFATSLLLILIITLSFSSCNDDDLEINSKSDFDSYLEDEMDFQDIPALSTLIFKENTILYERYSGTPSLLSSISLQEDDLFLLASVSKVITATALLRLYDQGLFALDDKINDYLPFTVNVPNQSTDISFRMLLTHTSAIADGSVLDQHYYDNTDSPISLNYFLENYLVPSGAYYNAGENFYNFQPGTDQEYSNTGNTLIALLVEEISGMGFNEYCKQHLFTPLGMGNTFWRLDEISQTIVMPYDDDQEIPHYTFTDYPNGGLRSTCRDLFKLIAAFTGDGQYNGYQLLKASTVNEMVTLQIPGLSSDTGLHLFKLNSQHNLWGHDGGEKGVSTIMAFNPATKIGAIILTNQGEAELDEILIEAYKLGLKL